MLSGVISNIQKFSLQDGPGIRTTVFLKGCPLQCAWCHNPENISPRPEVVVLAARCVRCGQCVQACPEQTGTEAEINQTAADCQLCGLCAEACPSGARNLVGQSMTVEELLAEILADRTFYDESHGGITFSGGEPLLQFDFLYAMLQACRREGLHTAVDTSGFAPKEHLLALTSFTDLFLYDLKFIAPALHRQFTGVSNELILENLDFLNKAQQAIWLRLPIIPGVNDSPTELEAMARLAASFPAIQQVNLLPYHKTGIQKFKRLGREYRLPEVTPPSAEYMKWLAENFFKGLRVKIGG